MIMLLRKPCHMPFHKLIPLFTLTMGEIKTGNARFPALIQFDLIYTALIKHSQFREYFFFLNHRKIFHQKLELSAISLSLFTCSSFYIDFISRKLR